MQAQIQQAYERAVDYIESHPTDSIAHATPILVGTDRNGYTGIVFPTHNGMAVEINTGLPTSHGKLHAQYIPVAFATACYR